MPDSMPPLTSSRDRSRPHPGGGEGNVQTLKRKSRFFERLVSFPAVLAGAVIMFLTLLISADVTLRYFLNSPISHVTEMTEHGLLFVTFLGAAWVQRQEKHASVDLLYIQLSPRWRIMSKFITSILGAILCLGMTWFSAQATIIAFQRGTIFATIWGLPRGPILSIIPIGSFLLLVQFIIQSLSHLDQWKTMGRGNSRT